VYISSKLFGSFSRQRKYSQYLPFVIFKGQADDMGPREVSQRTSKSVVGCTRDRRVRPTSSLSLPALNHSFSLSLVRNKICLPLPRVERFKLFGSWRSNQNKLGLKCAAASLLFLFLFVFLVTTEDSCLTSLS
jgi:hypothetical protein